MDCIGFNEIDGTVQAAEWRIEEGAQSFKMELRKLPAPQELKASAAKLIAQLRAKRGDRKGL